MKHRNLWRRCGTLLAVIFAFFLQIGPTWAAPGGAPLAILTDVRGSVQVVRGGRQTKATNGAQLRANDVVRVAKGTATVYYVTRPPQTLRDGQQVVVGASAGASKAPSVWSNVYRGLSQGFARRGQVTAAAMRDPFIELVSPARSKTLETRPTFIWTVGTTSANSRAEIHDYLVTVADKVGKTLWEGEATTLSIAYPPTAPLLQAGQEYTWTVIARRADELGLPEPIDNLKQTSTFTIATAAERTTVQADQAQLQKDLKAAPATLRRVAVAAVLSQHGFETAAAQALVPDLTQTALQNHQALDELTALQPKLDETTRLLLRSIYLKTGQLRLANVLSPATQTS